MDIGCGDGGEVWGGGGGVQCVPIALIWPSGWSQGVRRQPQPRRWQALANP